MKISKIHIHNFFQFKNFELDLTYPKGHEKEGQALDRVCLIGQSGTGKTTLLELIKKAALSANFHDIRRRPEYKLLKISPDQGFDFVFDKKVESGENFRVSFWANENGQELNGKNENIKNPIVESLLYFPAGLSNVVLSENDQPDTFRVEEVKENYLKQETPYYVFNKAILENVWQHFYQSVREYQADEANYRISLTKKIEQGEKFDLFEAIKAWKADHPNPLVKIAAECLDHILNKFHLSVKTDLDDVRKINILQIQSLITNTVVPYEKLSSGTRQIIYTAFPIYQLIEKDSLILIDQPEDALYPDVQQGLIPYYTSLDKEKKSQFFFATHSPIIASSFEPWEVVELKFDETGQKIIREKYYEGANHVDNYHTDPRYLRWDSILMDVFDLKEEGNVEFRSKMLTEFSILKRKIEALEKAGALKSKTKEVQQIIDQYKKAGTLLGWEIENDKYEKD